MNAELTDYVESLESRFEKMCACIDGMSTAQLNAAPIDGGNSAWVIVTHTIGNARAWILGIVPGVERRRDRDSEFAAKAGDAGDLAREAQVAVAEIRSALAALDPARLDARMTPAQELWGAGATRELTVRGAILHVIEHASLHLGHLELTADLARASR